MICGELHYLNYPWAMARTLSLRRARRDCASYRSGLSFFFFLFVFYYAYRIGKDFGLDFEVILIVFEVILDSFLNDFGGHIGMILIIF